MKRWRTLLTVVVAVLCCTPVRADFNPAIGPFTAGQTALSAQQLNDAIGRRRYYSAIAAGEQVAYTDLIANYWNASLNAIAPVAGGYTFTPGTGGTPTTYWQTAIAENALYWHWRLTGNRDTLAKLQGHWAWLRANYTNAQLSSADQNQNNLITATLDDAALALTVLVHMHETSGDQTLLPIMTAMVNSTYSYFADPNNGGAGLVYATPAQGGNPQKTSQLIEALVARQALYVYRQTGNATMLARAKGTWQWIQTYLNAGVLSTPLAGTYFCDLNIDPAAGASYRKPIVGSGVQYYGTRGSALTYLGGNFAYGSLSAELYLLTGDPKYLAALNTLVAAMQQTNTFARTSVPAGVTVSGPVLIAARDGWSDGYFAPLFVADALSIVGVDADGKLAAMLQNTASSIIQQRTSDGHYTADWGPNELEASGVYSTWEAQSLNDGHPSAQGPNQEASAKQVMTTGMAIAMIEAGVMTVPTRMARP